MMKKMWREAKIAKERKIRMNLPGNGSFFSSMRIRLLLIVYIHGLPLLSKPHQMWRHLFARRVGKIWKSKEESITSPCCAAGEFLKIDWLEHSEERSVGLGLRKANLLVVNWPWIQVSPTDPPLRYRNVLREPWPMSKSETDKATLQIPNAHGFSEQVKSKNSPERCAVRIEAK